MLLACRVCLSTSRRMKKVANTSLQAMFEKLTGNQLRTGTGMPECVCYICHLQLQRCCRFVNQFQKADHFLRKLIYDGIELTERNLAGYNISTWNDTLTVSSTVFVSVQDFNKNESSKIVVKIEPESIVKTDAENTAVTTDVIETLQMDTVDQESSYDTSDENSDTLLIQKREGIKSIQYYVPITPEQPDSETTSKDLGDPRKTLTIDKKLTNGLKNVVKGKQKSRKKKKNSKHSKKTDIKMYRNQKGPYHCDICPKIFKQKVSLNCHIRSHTGEKPYSCNECTETFRDSTLLKYHVRGHKGEDPYTCKTCFKSFNQKPHLTEHLRTHTGEKPHACQQCPSTFAHKGSLRRHERTHTGEKPYICQKCSRQFTQISNLKKHVRSCKIEKCQHKCVKCVK